MNRRKYLGSIIGVGSILLTSGCIDKNSIDYSFEFIDIEELSGMSGKDDIPEIQNYDEKIVIKSIMSFGDCEEPEVSYINYKSTKRQINIKIENKSTKGPIEKYVNLGCTLALNSAAYKVTIPKNDMKVKTIHIIEKQSSNENTDVTIEV